MPVLIDCLRMVLHPHYEVALTPSALESGASQREQIIELIEKCSFAVVILDGLRPNVVFELGLTQAKNKPLILFKESDALVDILGLYSSPTAELKINAPPVNLDTQLSNAKDINYAPWNRFDVKGTIKLVWSEYLKKKDDIHGYVDIAEPTICQ
ncbi:MAG: hypothetical protein WCF88_16755 [Candidatus Acidiferrales bacterium]